jgi:hypothetical protein
VQCRRPCVEDAPFRRIHQSLSNRRMVARFRFGQGRKDGRLRGPDDGSLCLRLLLGISTPPRQQEQSNQSMMEMGSNQRFTKITLRIKAPSMNAAPMIALYSRCRM